MDARNDEAAIRAFRRAAEVEPDCAPARYYLGVLLSVRGDRVGARAEWRSLRRLDPDLAELLWLRLR